MTVGVFHFYADVVVIFIPTEPEFIFHGKRGSIVAAVVVEENVLEIDENSSSESDS